MLSLVGGWGGACSFPVPGIRGCPGGTEGFPEDGCCSEELSMFPPPFSPAHGRLEGVAGTNSPSHPLSCQRPSSCRDPGSPQPPLLYPVYAAESSRDKCLQRFISCAKPKQNFHTSPSNSGGALVLGGEDGTVAGTLVPSPDGPEAPEGACRKPTGRFRGRQGGGLSVRSCVRGDKGSRVVVPLSRLTLRLWPQRGGSGPGSL